MCRAGTALIFTGQPKSGSGGGRTSSDTAIRWKTGRSLAVICWKKASYQRKCRDGRQEIQQGAGREILGFDCRSLAGCIDWFAFTFGKGVDLVNDLECVAGSYEAVAVDVEVGSAGRRRDCLL